MNNIDINYFMDCGINADFRSNPLTVIPPQGTDKVALTKAYLRNIEGVTKVVQDHREGACSIRYICDQSTPNQFYVKLIGNCDLKGHEVDLFENEFLLLKELEEVPDILNAYNIVRVFYENQLVTEFMKLEYRGEPTLYDGRQYINNNQKAAFILQFAKVISEIHRRGIIHRDLKPSNVFVGIENNPILFDFGLATKLDNDILADVETGIGSIKYMAPDFVFDKTPDVRQDIYSFGATAYDLLTGQCPYYHKNINYIAKQKIEGNLDLLIPVLEDAKISRAMSKIVLGCLEKNPKNRYQTMDEVVEELIKMQRPKKKRKIWSGFSKFVSLLKKQ